MLAGHIGAGLAIASAERSVNAGAFVAAALLLDLLLWVFVLAGWESVRIPADFARTHVPEFTFPYSHGLAAAAGWSLLAAGAMFLSRVRDRRGGARAAGLIAAAVLSHWLLDALVHSTGLPLGGGSSPRIGLALWLDLPVALALEALITLAGLWWFVRGSAFARGRRIGLAAVTLAVLAFTVAGMTLAPAPPSAQAMAASSLAMLAVLCAVFFWIGRGANPGVVRPRA